MYSTKNIENILLAELSRNQYNRWMSDSLEHSKSTLKNIVNLYKTPTFQSIFNGKRRIFIPLELEKITEEEKHSIQINYYYDKMPYQIREIISNYIKFVYIIYFLLTSEKVDDVIYDADDMVTADSVLKFINGTIINPKTNKPEKFAKFVQKLIDLSIKNNILEKIESNANLARSIDFYQDEIKIKGKSPQNVFEALQMIINQFNGRKDWIPQKVLSVFNEVTDKYYAVISCDPQDVGAMSTGQGWTSCQDLDKKGKGNIVYNKWNWHTLYDVPKGTCVAYLLSEQKWKQSEKDFTKARADWFEQNKDKSAKEKMYFKNAPIKGATARIAIKPFYGIEDKNKGQIYLSIGDNPIVYGTTSIEKYFVAAVNEYLITKQSFLNGEFKIPRELYNEGLGNDSHFSDKNIIIVKNGKIAGTSGYNDMMRYETAIDINKLDIDTQSAVYTMIFENIDAYNNATAIYNCDIYSNEYQNNLKTICIAEVAESKISNCNQIDIYGTNKEYDIENQLDDTIEAGVFFTQENISHLTSTNDLPDLDVNNLIDWLEYEVRNTDDSYATRQGTSIESTKFENINKIILHDSYIDFQSCAFKNCNIILLSDNDKIISSQFNWCKFENCTITTDFHDYSEYTYSMDGHNTYTNVTFNISSDEIYYFYKDKFINCKFKNPKILSKVIFDQCNVNNEPHNTDGDYIIDKNIDLDSITELVLEPEMFVLYEEDDEEE